MEEHLCKISLIFMLSLMQHSFTTENDDSEHSFQTTQHPPQKKTKIRKFHLKHDNTHKYKVENVPKDVLILLNTQIKTLNFTPLLNPCVH